MLTRDGCPFCARAKGLLHDAGIEFEELSLGSDFSDQSLRAFSEEHTYPQVFVDGQRIGGSDALQQWLEQRQATKARSAA